ncbi:flagellar biosynthesis protein FlhF [Polynucleobacter sp. MWH-Berg-3C6]|uniref:flagellar biosynthesis protein FlhF n=1 Tax=Polynucleobacter sp. MWH-Berg-3C6 TaxID=1855882 RepID=UPI001C0DE2CE|nr:flagellar biosynthesis protein FlhF [Polynucleobacter sp. MWH-Berg-3C6]MBU3550686.1 flagellar biosynthesis protein FlhF [Polynucleobacter sp. MWH-Berg-3C6]
MGPQKFTAANSAEALKMVRDKMGSDAMILSSKDVDEGVEIVAISPDALAHLASQKNPFLANKTSGNQDSNASTPEPQLNTPVFEEITKEVLPKITTPSMDVGGLIVKDIITSSPADASNGANGVNANPLAASSVSAMPTMPTESPRVEQLFSEIEVVKKLLQSHLASSYWNNLQQESAGHAEVTKTLLSAGFSPKLCAELVQNLSETGDVKSLLAEVQKRLEHSIKTIDPLEAFDRGGIFAFIGPTGVGKTTTVAKVAARCVLRYGRNQVALLSTDTYRIGAQEQLKVFARILGLPVISLRDSEDLESKLNELSQRHIILLDTAGVNQRDVLMIEQSQLLKEGSRDAHRILVMSSTTDLRTQEDVIMLHNQASIDANQSRIMGAIITKTDEAAQIAPVLDSLMRHELPLMFLSNGQRVPEDLSQANVAYLAHRAMHPRSLSNNLNVMDDQIPALMADYLNDWMKKNSL